MTQIFSEISHAPFQDDTDVREKVGLVSGKSAGRVEGKRGGWRDRRSSWRIFNLIDESRDQKFLR